MKRPPLDSGLDGAARRATEEDELALFLEMARAAFEADQTNALPAFEALTYVAAYWWNKDSAPDEVELPFWALEVIVAGYKRYENANREPRGPTLGEALGIEGGGQGKRRRIGQWHSELRNMRIAIRLVLAEEREAKLEAEIAAIAEAERLDASTIRDLWTKWAERSRAALRRWRSSGDG